LAFTGLTPLHRGLSLLDPVGEDILLAVVEQGSDLGIALVANLVHLRHAGLAGFRSVVAGAFGLHFGAQGPHLSCLLFEDCSHTLLLVSSEREQFGQGLQLLLRTTASACLAAWGRAGLCVGWRAGRWAIGRLRKRNSCTERQ
jgi:hypothetical protein